MHDLLKIVLTFYSTLFLSSSALAVDPGKNNQLTCFAKHLDTNKEVAVKTAPGITSKHVATAQWPLGYPTIVIDDSAFLKLPTNARQFIYYHECAHLKYKLDNEFEADCKALELIQNKHQLSEIDTRKLVKTLVKEFGMSRRWSVLLQCDLTNKLE